MRAFLWLLVMLLGVSPLWACNPEPGPNHFPPPPQLSIPVGYFEVHNTLSGLPCNSIRSLLALEKYVFAGTEGEGLMIFDGGVWRQFTPTTNPPFPAPTVSCFFQASDELILAGTPNGIVKITGFADEKGVKFEQVVPKGPLGPDVLSIAKAPAGSDLLAGTFYGAGTYSGIAINPFKILEPIPPTGFSSIKRSGTSTWFGSSDGLMELQGTTLVMRNFPPNDFGWVQALEADGKNLLVGGSKGLFTMTDNSCREVLPGIWTTALWLTPGVSDIFLGNASQSLEVASGSMGVHDSLGLANAQRILQEMNVRYQRIMAAWNQGTLLTADYNAYLQDLATIHDKVSASLMKGLWVGTQDAGVILFSDDGGRRHFTKENSKLPSNRVTAISGLPSGETWIGTFDGGILRYRRYTLLVNDKPDPVYAGDAQTIEVFGENLYVGTKQDGLYVFHVKTLSQLNHLSPENREKFHTRVDSLAADREGNIWIAGNSGLWKLGSGGAGQFGMKEGLPAPETVKVCVDQDGRVYVAVRAEGKSISSHIAGFNGEGFTSYSVDQLRAILALPAGDRDAALRTMGLTDTYQQAFDAKNATQALALYDSGNPEARVTALLGTPNYLLIGTDSGNQFVFDGSAFKPLTIIGPGNVGKVLAYGKRGNGNIVTLGSDRMTTFDGQAFSPVFGVASPTVSRYTDLCLDDMNPDLFWTSFETGNGGGFALYQHPKWDAIPYGDVILGIARSFPFMFAITPTGVYRFQL